MAEVEVSKALVAGGTSAYLLAFDPLLPEHVAPAHDFILEIGRECHRAAWRRRDPGMLKLAADLWIRECGIERSIELRNLGGRRECRREDACPLIGDGVRKSLLDQCRHVGEGLGAALRRCCQSLELSGFDLS